MKIKTLMLSAAIIASCGSAFSDDGTAGNGGMQTNIRTVAAPDITTVITPKNNIDITFYSDLGIVSATIKNNAGTVVSKSYVDTANNTNLKIDIANLPSGSYTLIIADNKGATLKSERFIVDSE